MKELTARDKAMYLCNLMPKKYALLAVAEILDELDPVEQEVRHRYYEQVRVEIDKYIVEKTYDGYKLKFGMHKGKKLMDTPFDYLRWLAKQEFSPKEVVKYIEKHKDFI